MGTADALREDLKALVGLEVRFNEGLRDKVELLFPRWVHDLVRRTIRARKLRVLEKGEYLKCSSIELPPDGICTAATIIDAILYHVHFRYNISQESAKVVSVDLVRMTAFSEVNI